MCGRFTPASMQTNRLIIHGLQEQLPLINEPFAKDALADVYPHRNAYVITQDALDAHALTDQELTWGYLPFKDTDLVFNTRLETAATSKLWADSLAHRRCIVPAWAFYERHKSEHAVNDAGKRIKQLYRFTQGATADAQRLIPILMAGVWREERFSVVTVAPHAEMAPIHPRMPLCLNEDEARAWLFGGYDAQTLLHREVSDQSFHAEPIYTPEPKQVQLKLF